MMLVEGDGQVRSFYVSYVNGKDLRSRIVATVDRASHLMTDESMVHARVGGEFADHLVMNQSVEDTSLPAASGAATPPETSYQSSSAARLAPHTTWARLTLGRYTAEFDFR
ncbi:transposase [Sphingobium lactosutens]|uniref:transposase n=1 Tax=Sphingobium lactosutens TaxID=522773 RepID=UPI000418B10C|nr:transposase [Sphingobium lactosutens]